jgi:subtilase family serine protease
VVGSPTCTTAHAGLTPCDLQAAYALPSSSAGAGETVAIVDAYNDPNAEADLGKYRTAYGLPACTTANGCFHKVNQNGGTTYPGANTGWSEEISLDVDMVSAACPKCHILLVEANSNNLGDLVTAEQEAAALGANAISNSWAANEFSLETLYDSSFNLNIPITASSGDSGYGVGWPAASPYVTAVGGTSLVPAANARGWSETAWSGAGSGCSAFEAKPAWQTDPSCANRTVADVSAVADPNTGVATYDSFNQPGWLVFGGTSVAAPIVASVYALAANGATITSPGYGYAHATSLFDVTSGSNGSCGGSYLCTAGPGYDGPTGLGTPNGTGAF